MTRTRTLTLVGGGTGGHVYPAVAIAEAWLARGPGHRVSFIGSPEGLEARVIPELGYPFTAAKARRLKNAGLVERSRSLLTMPGAIARGRRLIKSHAPDVVLGVGGYVSGPVVLAASLTGLPVAVAEQNAVPGLTNRMLSRFAKRIYTAFPEAESRLPADKVRCLGNPVRRAILDASERTPEPEGRRVLVIGGSQGARALNRDLPHALARAGAEFPDLQVTHLAGPDRRAEAAEQYAAAGFERVTVLEYLDDMASAFAQADLVVARAGATTVAELAVMGRPSLLVPFPHAADDHQTANAQSLVSAGGAVMVPEHTFESGALLEHLMTLLSDLEGLRRMARSARAHGRPKAAVDIAADLDALAALATGQPARSAS
ncbi:MAG: undecaprenyldiphospho-muramoylpentapeptide beta-N-acetylglucosaminyltransferase [Bradymonadia bacterium]